MSKESFEDKLRRRAAENREQFNVLYQVQITELMGLSKSEIDVISPKAKDREVYDKLILAVKEASVQNLSQADLKQKITELGGIAIAIAKKVPSLAAILL